MTPLESFRRLPEPAQAEVVELLTAAMRWRGRDAGSLGPAGGLLPHAVTLVARIATVYADNGQEMDEYT